MPIKSLANIGKIVYSANATAKLLPARLLQPAFFRFYLKIDTLALGYMLPIIRAH